MISFMQEGTKVKIQANPKMHNGNVMYFYWECGTEWYAELLTKQLQDCLAESIRGIRSDEYNEGWKAAKAKTFKKLYFMSSFFRK